MAHHYGSHCGSRGSFFVNFGGRLAFAWASSSLGGVRPRILDVCLVDCCSSPLQVQAWFLAHARRITGFGRSVLAFLVTDLLDDFTVMRFAPLVVDMWVNWKAIRCFATRQPRMLVCSVVLVLNRGIVLVVSVYDFRKLRWHASLCVGELESRPPSTNFTLSTLDVHGKTCLTSAFHVCCWTPVHVLRRGLQHLG